MEPSKILPVAFLIGAIAASYGLPTNEADIELPASIVNTDFYESGQASPDKVELGRLLFFDKLLSGNKNISCATCHHPKHGSSDGMSLSFGEGPAGLGPERRPGDQLMQSIHGRIPRNSPALFNVGAKEFQRLFHDGRVEADPHGYYEGGFITPAKWKLPTGLESVLAAQAMFPVTSDGEMAGQKGENPIADAASLNNAAGPGGIWELLANRLREIPEYVSLFHNAYPDIQTSDDITFVHAANAIAAFETASFRSDQSPFDDYLNGKRNALTQSQLRGLKLFYGKANCASCHSGKFQTDHQFHAIAMPQIGPGKADGKDGGYWRASGTPGFVEDFGRGRVTVKPADNYKFRTPSLRNVTLTGPWGHTGAYDNLREVVLHHLHPVSALHAYQLPNGLLPPVDQIAEVTVQGSRLDYEWLNAERLQGFLMRDTWVVNSQVLRERIAAANELQPLKLTATEIDDLMAFLHSLTDPECVDMSDLVPERVPSGLSVND